MAAFIHSSVRRPAALALVSSAAALDVSACFALAGASGARNDLYPRWLATRLWLSTGQDLYSPATDAAIREAMGAPPLGGETFVFGFVYPAYVALLLAPLALVPFRAAATFWLMLAQAAAVGGALLAWRASERERGLPPASALPALILAALLPATVMNVLFLQFSALAFLGLALSWWCLVRGRHIGAAVALVFALVKPQLAALPAAGVLAQALVSGSGRCPAAAGAAGAVVAVASLAVFPGWLDRFFESAGRYTSVARPASASTLLGSMLPFDGVSTVLAGTGVAAVVALTWWRSRRLVGDALSATSLLTIWLVPPLYEWNSALLLLPLVTALRTVRTRGARGCWAVCAALVVASAATLWAYTTWPSESRLIWPVVALGLYLAVFGSQSVTASAPSPSSAVRS